MIENEESEGTPFPGKRLPDMEVKEISKRFLLAFRAEEKGKFLSGIPTACLIKGPDTPDILGRESFLGLNRVFFLLEGPLRIFETSALAVQAFVEGKDVWEDYNICVFDESYEWCIGITHNDTILVSDQNGKFESPALPSIP